MTESDLGAADLELISSAQAGDREAFAILYGRYWPRAVRMATVVCGSPRTAKDVVRITFAEAWRTCGDYSAEQGSVHSWLFGLVRDQAAYAREGESLWGQARYHPSASAHDSHDDMPELDDVGADAAAAIALLLADAPDDQRELVAMAFFGELSPKEISSHLNLTEDLVEGRMRLGLDELRSRKFTPGS